MGYLVGYTYRTFNGFCERKWGGTPLESLREKRGGQIPRTFPFGIMGSCEARYMHRSGKARGWCLVLIWGPGTAQVVVVWFTLFLLTPLE